MTEPKSNTLAGLQDEMERGSSTKYILGVFCAVLFVSTGGVFVRLSPLPAVNTGFWRILFSLPMLLLCVAIENKGLAVLAHIEKRDWLMMLIGGVGLGLDLLLWNLSFDYTTLANANLFGTLVTLTIVPVSYFVFKEKIPKTFLLGGIISIVGLVLLLSGKLNPSPENFGGDALAFGASVFYAIFLLAVYKTRDRVKSLAIMFVASLSCCVTMFIGAWAIEGIVPPQSFADAWPALATALCSSLIGQGILGFCLGKVSASLSSIILLSQPAVAAVYGFLFFQETLTWMEIAGMLVTIAGIYFAKKGSKIS